MSALFWAIIMILISFFSGVLVSILIYSVMRHEEITNGVMQYGKKFYKITPL